MHGQVVKTKKASKLDRAIALRRDSYRLGVATDISISL